MTTEQSIPANPYFKPAPVKAAVVCMILAWVAALAPIPVISTLATIALNITAFVLAILCIARQRVGAGIGVIAGVVFTFVLYTFSYPLWIGLHTLLHYESEQAKTSTSSSSSASASIPHSVSSPFATDTKSTVASAAAASPPTDQVGLPKLEGNWHGEYRFGSQAPVDFELTIRGSADGFLGDAVESAVINGQNTQIRSQISGSLNNGRLEFDKQFWLSGKSHVIHYSAATDGNQNVIEGTWSDRGSRNKGSFKLQRQ